MASATGGAGTAESEAAAEAEEVGVGFMEGPFVPILQKLMQAGLKPRATPPRAISTALEGEGVSSMEGPFVPILGDLTAAGLAPKAKVRADAHPTGPAPTVSAASPQSPAPLFRRGLRRLWPCRTAARRWKRRSARRCAATAPPPYRRAASSPSACGAARRSAERRGGGATSSAFPFAGKHGTGLSTMCVGCVAWRR